MSGSLAQPLDDQAVRSPAASPPRAPRDLRLVPAALATWLTAGVVVGLPPMAAAVAAGLGALAAVAVLLRHRRRTAAWPRGQGGRGDRGRAPGPRHRGDGPLVGGLLLSLAAVSACAAVAGVSAHARTAGWWGDLVHDAATVRLTGVVRSDPVPFRSRFEDSGGGRVRLQVTVHEVVGRGVGSRTRAPVLVLGQRGWHDVSVGERIRFSGRLAPAPRGDDVTAVLVALGAPQPLREPTVVEQVIHRHRQGLMAASAGLPPDAAGLVPGIAIGDTSRLPTDLQDAMRATSLTHLTAVSGAHVAIILGALLALTVWLPVLPRAALCTLALIVFVLLVRPEPSVLRAAAMGGVAVLGLLLGRPSRAAPALAGSVIVLVLLDPWIARSYGFALSVLATAGLVLVAPVWAARLSSHVPPWLAHGLAIPAAANLACAPVVLLLEPAVALYAVPANLLAGPAVPPATVLGVLATATAGQWPSLAAPLVAVAGVGATWIAAVARTMSGLPAAQLPWPPGLAGALLLGLLSVLVIVLTTRRDGPRAGVQGAWLALVGWSGRRGLRGFVPVVWLVVALVAVVLVLPATLWVRLLPGGPFPPDWGVIACDVGQGAAVLVRSGPDAAVVVDVGPPGAGARQCLDRARVRHVDLLVLTHLHEDHIGGLAGALAGRSVDAALVTPYPEPARARASVAAALARARVRVAMPSVGAPASSGKAGSVLWHVLAPAPSAVGRAVGDDGTTLNDLSLALHLRTPELSLVVLGDLETDGQAALARRIRLGGAGVVGGEGAGYAAADSEAGRPNVDAVVVAHHGSARQDRGLARLLSPHLALISAGADNPHGHPSPSAIELYRGVGSTVLSTSDCGDVVVVSSPLATISECPSSTAGAVSLDERSAAERRVRSMSALRGRLSAWRRHALPPPVVPHPPVGREGPPRRSRWPSSRS